MENHRILLVDDDPDHLLVCKLIFERRHFQVHTIPGCETLDALLDQTRTINPTLIFMDHEMPGVRGDEAIKALKSSPHTSHIPVIYFSGTTDIEDLARQAGADGFIQKPFLIESLVSLAHQYNASLPPQNSSSPLPQNASPLPQNTSPLPQNASPLSQNASPLPQNTNTIPLPSLPVNPNP